MEKVSSRSKKGSLGDFLRNLEVCKLADEKYLRSFGSALGARGNHLMPQEICEHPASNDRKGNTVRQKRFISQLANFKVTQKISQ